MSEALSPDRVRLDIAEMLGCDPSEIAPDTNLQDLGLDSVRLMTLIERWRANGAAEVELPDLAERPELAHWLTLLTGEKA